MSIQAMKQALDYLRLARDYGIALGIGNTSITDAINELLIAIEAAEKVEPVGYVEGLFDESVIKQCGFKRDQAVYFAPQPAIHEGLRVIGYLDGLDRFFYADDPLMIKDHKGMRECYAAPKPEGME